MTEELNANEEIDIILITHGKLDALTRHCVKAIYDNTRSRFRLIVVDDSTPDMDDGTDETPAFFERLKLQYTNVLYIHSEDQFVCGNQIFNIGLANSSNRFVATVMNSVMVEPDWDVMALQMMQAGPKIGILGLKCLKLGWGKGPNGEELDGAIESAGIYMNGLMPYDLGRDEWSHRRTCSYPTFSLQWAFALLRREAVAGNLREDIYNGFVGFDDIDNTLYLRYKGWEAWYCGLGAGFHQTHATRGGNTDDKFLANRRNAEAFYKRWGYWETFREENPYAPDYGIEVEFLCNANDLPLRVDNPEETD